MSIEKFMTGLFGGAIQKVAIDKETEKTFWLKGTRHPKEGGYLKIHDTWDEAKNHLIDKAKTELDRALLNVNRKESELKKVEELEKPKGL